MIWPRGTRLSSSRSNSMNSLARWRGRTIPDTCPVCTQNAARRSAVPCRTYSNSRRAGWPGATGWLGAAGSRTPIPVFSSTQKVGPSVGGCNSNSMIATALATKSGSRSSIQESKPVQADVGRLEDLADRALAGPAQVEFGMLADILGQVHDGPVRLACPPQGGRGLAGQQDDLRLPLGPVPAGGRLVGTIVQARQPLSGEAVAPALDRMPDDAQRGGNGLIARTGRRAQDDLGPQDGLLRARARPDAALQFGAFIQSEVDDRRMPTHGAAPSTARPQAAPEPTSIVSLRSRMNRMLY